MTLYREKQCPNCLYYTDTTVPNIKVCGWRNYSIKGETKRKCANFVPKDK